MTDITLNSAFRLKVPTTDQLEQLANEFNKKKNDMVDDIINQRQKIADNKAQEVDDWSSDYPDLKLMGERLSSLVDLVDDRGIGPDTVIPADLLKRVRESENSYEQVI